MIVELLEGELSRHRDHSAIAQWAIELLASRRFKRYLRITKAGGKTGRNGLNFVDTRLILPIGANPSWPRLPDDL